MINYDHPDLDTTSAIFWDSWWHECDMDKADDILITSDRRSRASWSWRTSIRWRARTWQRGSWNVWTSIGRCPDFTPQECPRNFHDWQIGHVVALCCTMLHYVALCCTMLHYTTGGRTGELLNALESIQVELRKEKPALLSAMTRAFRVEARLPSWAKPVLQSAPRITRWIPVNPVSFPSGLQHCVGEVHQWLSTLRGSISAEQDMTCMTHGHTWTYMVKHGQAFSQAIQHQPIQCHAVRAGGKPCNDVMLMRGLWTLWSTQASKQKRRLWAALYVLLLKIETVQSWDWRIALVISWNSSKNLHRKS